MAAYNVQSLFIFFAIFSLLGGLVACVYFRRLDSSARYWVFAALLTGSTNLVTVFRTELPLLWSYSIPIGLSGAGFVLMGMGLVQLYEPAPRRRQWLALALATALFIVLMEWCRIHAGARVTLLLSGGLLGLTAIWGAYPAHRYYLLTGNQFAMHLRWIMVGLGLLHLVRTQAVITGWAVNTFGQDAWTLGLWSAIFVSGSLRYFGYVALRVQESDDEKIKVAAALAREEEGRRLGAQLALQDRQQSLGVMSASFAHELNQPLTAILNYAELLQYQQRSRKVDAQVTERALNDIVANCVRAGEIIRRIRTFIQPAALKKESVDLRGVIHEVCALVEAEARRSGIDILKPTLPQSPVWVLGDAVQLSQVLFNVVRNAMESVASVPVRVVRLSLQQEQRQWQLGVHDSGPGLTDEVSRQAGDPFFTTKISGLGMGLSISKTILAQYGGRLSLINTGHGACALINLPMAEVS